MGRMFRLLRADEIECRIQSVKKNGLILLLYKDARCDMNILDETVGVMNWKKSYQLIDGQLFCTIEIWDDEKKQWIGKQDVGVESNTEAEKGRASDAQKRSAFAMGIGRELYSAPFIWISSTDCTITDGKCFDRFAVHEIGYDDDGRINKLSIKNTKTSRIVFRMGKEEAYDMTDGKVSEREKRTLKDMCANLGVSFGDVAKQAGWEPGMEWNAELHGKCSLILKEIEEGKR